MVGRPVLRREDERFLTGRGCYVDDIKLPGMVDAAIVRSPIAHGKIRSIDLTAARAAPGVLGIVIAADLEGYADYIPIPDVVKMPGYERFLEWPIARDVVRFVGEPVAIVVAENRFLAEDAAELVEVDYEILEAVTNVDQALTDAVLVHEAAGTNLACRYDVARGDTAAAFAAPFYTRKEVFRIHRHTGMPLETRGFLSEWDAATGKLTCYGANKNPHRTRDTLARMLKLNKQDVTLVENDAGGNFGVRGHFYPEDLLVAFMAIRLNRPVKYIEDRREHLMMTNHSREGGCELEIAVGEDGQIAGLRARVFCDLGAYAAGIGGSVVPAKTVQFIPGPYKIDNYACELSVLITNKTPVGAYRGPGRYEGAFYMERLLDLAARDLGLDPVEFRMKNLIRAEQMPYMGGNMVPYMGESPYDTGDYQQVLDHALKLVDYANLKKLSGTTIDGKMHGVAVCCYVDSTGQGPGEESRVVIKSPREVEVYVGSSTSGQGHETVMAQIAADQLGIPYDWIRVFHGSTNYVEQGWGHGHSRCAVMGGSAVHIAAGNLVEQLLKVAALRFNEAPDSLEYRAGAFYRRGEAVPIVRFEDFVQSVADDLDGMDRLQATGKYVNSKLTYSYGTQIAHVAVDPDTAKIDVLRFLTVEDIGRAINPMIVHGQTIGAALQGISGTILDEFVYDSEGQLLTGSFADYLLATSTEFPNIEAETLQNAPSPTNPLGVKGAGEGAIATTGAVLANAVCNALAPFDVQIYDLPLSPNKLARAIREAKAGRATRPLTGADAKFGFDYR
jgi:carbon-monoxide dehydrogenase large subunit